MIKFMINISAKLEFIRYLPNNATSLNIPRTAYERIISFVLT